MPSTRADTPEGDEERARVRAAEAGEPRAVREILTALEAFLRGHDRIPRCYALFCADSFRAFVEDNRAWGRMSDEYHPWGVHPGANEEFEAYRSKGSPVETILGLGARLSEKRLGRVGTAACRAVHLTRRGTRAIERSSVEVSDKEPSLGSQAIRFTDHFSAAAELTTCGAHEGDPRALRELLHAVECSLYGGKPVPGRFAFFCAEALKQWLEDVEAWERIESYVRRAGRGSKPPIDDLRPLGRSFCQAFRLSRPKRLPKPGETPHEVGFCPTGVYKFERLLEYGVSWRRSCAIVSNVYPSLSSRTLDEWARLLEIRCGTVSEGRLLRNRLRLGARVLRETVQGGHSPEEAYLEAARWLARKLFPSLQSQMDAWAARVLRKAKPGHPRPDEHRELAQQIRAERERGVPQPAIPEKLAREILPEVRAEEASTFLSETLTAELVPAVRKAHAVAVELVDESPGWARVWAWLERRYSRQLLES